MSEKKFYISTPIYYTNAIPHIGNSYASLIANIIARYKKISGFEVKFSTGVDENSQKAVLKAEENNMEIMEYLDQMATKHKAVWDGIGIEYTDFIRTTEPRHHEFVRKVLQKSYEAGDIYAGEYEGKYCIGCESFKKDEDLIEKEGKLVCPDHLKEPEYIKEKNYFFKLSKYQKFLEDLYENNPEFVIPSERFNEVIAFVKRGLEDFSVSRETNKFGIPLPFDENQVTYVWYDALFNYLTVCQNGQEDFWPADLHIVGKDILRFHAIYWPAMLKSAGYELPKNILATGFFTIDGQKISKSLGNAINPVEFIEKYNKDLLILYLMTSINIGQDGDFSVEQAILNYNAKMANNLGNLLNRVIVLSLKLQENPGKLFGDFENGDFSLNITENLGNISKEDLGEMNEIFFDASNFNEENVLNKLIFSNFDNYKLKDVLDLSFAILDRLNKFADDTTPWITIKDENKQTETRNVLYIIAEGLRVVGLVLYPFFPEKMGELFTKLGLSEYSSRLSNGELHDLLSEKPKFEIKEKGSNLYDRFEV